MSGAQAAQLMTRKIQKFAEADMPNPGAGEGGLSHLIIWALVRLGVPTVFCIVLAYYVNQQDKRINAKDDLIQKNSERVLDAFEKNATALERLDQSIRHSNK